jgi:molybdopterin converting factor small subunit
MRVSIEFFGTQRVVAETNSIHMSITGETAVSEALEYVRRQYPALRLDRETILITVNHQVVPHDTLLKANDTVCFMPGIGGG